MDELVKLVSEKTGLNEELSRLAVDTVLDYLKANLPEAVGPQIDAVLSGEDTASGISGMAKGLGGLFGKKD
jgi:VIT1/CCC1 family predicted Fe2+/Mn2+ transporter